MVVMGCACERWWRGTEVVEDARELHHFYAVPEHTVPHFITPYHRCTTLYFKTMLHNAVPCFIMVHHAAPCRVVQAWN